MINVDSDDEGEDFSRVQKKRRVTKSIGSSFDLDMEWWTMDLNVNVVSCLVW